MDTPLPRPKRPSSEMEDFDECTPISKRINKLNIQAHSGTSDLSSHLQEAHHGLATNTPLMPPWWNGMDPPANGHYPSGFAASPLDLTSGVGASGHQHMIDQYSAMYSGMPIMQPMYADNHQEAVPLNLSCQYPQQSPEQTAYPELASPSFASEEREMNMNFEYDPELGERENPHYYHINQLLFKAHCERLRREGNHLESDLS